MTVNIRLLKELDSFIKQKSTGDPKRFASKTGISVAALYRYLNFIKQNGAPLKYNHLRKTYYYLEKGSIKIHFTAEEYD
ncbi:MAG: hypothetical protein GXO80_09895 [Chlorobi bacterium]|nr:hypothetical protein [Chlorobiota bacterium]